ncbi:MAG TPA: type IV pilus secretin PilQ [Vicinamibacterales bacterium]|nr:type IV pilus secretin PilQ [Vicinamibacterales bacterium]
MTATRGLASLFVVALAGALVAAAPGAPAAGTTAVPRLKNISSRVNSKGASLVIEATDPVAYVATRPDPLTVVLEFRNLSVDPATTSAIVPNAKSPIAAVAVEPSDTLGTGASRVRIALTQPVAHHVRSERNTVFVDFDKLSAKTAPYVMAPRESRTPNPDSRPDAMQALAQPQPVADPISTLGLTKVPEAPRVQQAAAAVPAPQTVDQPTTAPGQKKYSGHPISLDFQGADLRAVLRTFAEISGLNIVIDPTVQGSVDVALRDVPWDQALDIILRANKLGYIVDGTIVRIAPLTVLADEQSQQRKLSEEQALAGELRVLTKTLSYAKAEELQALLTKSALSQRGTVQIDPRTNTLIITDLSDRLTTASDLISTLDRPQPQVEIEARIVQTNKNFARALGVQWGFNGRVDPALGNTTPFAFPNNGSLGGAVGTTVGSGTAAVPGAVNLPAVGATSAVGLALGSVNGAFNLDVALSALETQGNGRILSTPRVTTQNNVAAEMTQGVQIPIQTVANNTVTVTFRDAALTLKVTPQITAANTVIMAISVENSQADFSRAVNGIPPINTQRANTSVLVTDGQTTVIGGIYVSQEQAVTDRTPGLGQIPLLKWLFKRESINDQNTELLIFITPRILKS